MLNNYYTMPSLADTTKRVDPVTANFLYVRFLGDRKKMDAYVEERISRGEQERHWDRLVWDRAAETQHWAQQVRELAQAAPERPAYMFFNNHYAGYAPGSLGLFAQAWKE